MDIGIICCIRERSCRRATFCPAPNASRYAVVALMIAMTIAFANRAACGAAAENVAMTLAKTPFATPYMLAHIPGAGVRSRVTEVVISAAEQ